jgi:hypothetical protein
MAIKPITSETVMKTINPPNTVACQTYYSPKWLSKEARRLVRDFVVIDQGATIALQYHSYVVRVGQHGASLIATGRRKDNGSLIEVSETL